MRRMFFGATMSALLTGAVFMWCGSPARADLFDYVKKDDGAFSWKKTNVLDAPGGKVYTLELVSQKWHDITWKHGVQVFLPKGVKPGAKMVIWNQGGSPGALSAVFGMELATKMQAPVAIVFGIPNQPLYNNLREDALIAETFVRYLKTKDESWPLLFPMVKSITRAMDALQQFAQQEWGVRVEQFIVTGASKRGWTSWLTAVADPRVMAIAPLVIDTLNMPVQMPEQLKAFGRYSDQIADYTKAGLVPLPDTPEAKKLWTMVDPYYYRDKIKVPVMIINGANDPYWTVDALNNYWDGLKTEKWVLYVPNAGHNLEQKNALGIKDRSRAINGLVAFVRHQLKSNPMPKLDWQHDDNAGKPRIRAQASESPKGARLWAADSSTRDFRKSTWHEQTVEVAGDRITASIGRPTSGFRAFFLELDFEIDGIRHNLSTQIRVVGKE